MIHFRHNLRFQKLIPLLLMGLLQFAGVMAASAQSCQAGTAPSKHACCVAKPSCDCPTTSSPTNTKGMAGCPCQLSPIDFPVPIASLNVDYASFGIPAGTAKLEFPGESSADTFAPVHLPNTAFTRSSSPPRAPPLLG